MIPVFQSLGLRLRLRALVLSVGVLILGGALAALRVLGGPVAQPAAAGPDVAAVLRAAEQAADPLAEQAGFPRKGDSDNFISYVRPSDELAWQVAAAQLGASASPAELQQTAEGLKTVWQRGAYHGPDPRQAERVIARQNAVLNAVARTGQVPARFDPPSGAAPDGDGSADASRPAATDGLDVEGRLRLLIIPVDFAGEDTAENFSHPVNMDDRSCVTETVTFKGPVHNEIAAPGPRDNNTLWLERFDRAFYEKLILSEEGVTERARMDLIDPLDGKPGIDLRGLTMANFYKEVSAGKVDFDAGPAGVLDWVKVPHSVGYYAASRCTNGRAPAVQAQNGLPANRNGVRQMATDVVAAINAANPDFPWADYDTDGNKVLDHIVFVHAGIDKSEGGGIHTYQQIWAHRGSANVVVDDMGTPDTTDDIRLRGYTVQPENLNLGVLVHEFGHDLGLPDLYDTSGLGNDTVVWWGLMSTGSHPGRLKGSDPTHMEPWSKLSLGWQAPRVITPTTDAETFTLGQASQPPTGTERSLMVPLPPTIVRSVPLPQGSTQMWHSGADQDQADVRLARTLDLTAVGVAQPVDLSFDLNFATEADFDYLVVEASRDGGLSWQQLKGFRTDTGAEVTTPDDYPDPNRALAGYGNLKYGYTGQSRGWWRVRHDLSALAGSTVSLRLRYLTDNGTLGFGFFADNFRLTVDGQPVWEDPVEGGDLNGWQSQPGSTAGTRGDGWRLSDGTRAFPRYYLLEWRNSTGFDRGLKWTYNTQYATLTADGRREFRVDKVPSNVPGLLVWVWDTRWGGNSPLSRNILTALPSEGGKGGVALMDAHPQPLRGPRDGKYTNALGSWPFPPNNNWTGRVQTTDAAFGFTPQAPMSLTVVTGFQDTATTVITATHFASRPAVPAFHDALGYSAGVEKLPLPITFSQDQGQTRIKDYAFTDADGGVTVPSSGYYPPRLPEGFTGRGGETAPPNADVSTEETLMVDSTGGAYAVSIGAVEGLDISGAQTGNPGDYSKQLGFHMVVEAQAEDGSWGKVRIWRDADAAELSADASAAGPLGAVDVALNLTNIGGAGDLLVYSDFDEAVLTYVGGAPGSSGLVAVKASQEDVAAAAQSGGLAAVAALEVPAAEARAVVWSGRLGSGSAAMAVYRLLATRPAVHLDIRNVALAAAKSKAVATYRLVKDLGSRAFLPMVRRGE
ncbi:MAG: immune inhibitor A [Ardenticatenia bacterium]|nr:immune inhibitor A [Ardenticatenia bacterium]